MIKLLISVMTLQSIIYPMLKSHKNGVYMEPQLNLGLGNNLILSSSGKKVN